MMMKWINGFIWYTIVAISLSLFPLSVWGDDSCDNVLLWMVYDNYGEPQIPDTGPTDLKYIDELRSRPGGYEINGARLRVDGTDKYLNFYASGSNVPNNVLPIQSDSGDGCFTQAGPVWTYLGTYASVEYSFLVELGHLEGDEWLVMAASSVTSYEDLVSGGWTTDNVRNYPRMGPWMPGFVVPEPSVGMLFMLGASLLALRRRR